ncbi:hypothetical protein GCM10020367_20660 [Streptomyces sannanensis]|uniref:Uncharacterized protein n=1 Tax=Streptomyces sannanensis TaxID=285536 RepID=A0ABP6S979_9ACTN
MTTTPDLHHVILTAITEYTREATSDLSQHATRDHLADLVTERLAEHGLAPELESEPTVMRAGGVYELQTVFGGTEHVHTFRAEYTTRHPEDGHLVAFGWTRNDKPGAQWGAHYVDEFEMPEWTERRTGYETDPGEFTIYRVKRGTITLGRYTTRSEAQAHGWDDFLNSTGLDGGQPLWRPNRGNDAIEHLWFTSDNGNCFTPYTVTALTVAHRYDPEADQ